MTTASPTEHGQTTTPASRPRSLLAGPYGHPFHPLMATLPIGAWVASLGFDVLSHVADVAWVYARAAYILTGTGALFAVVAAGLGLMDLLTVPRRTPAFRTGVQHLVLMDLTLVLFVISFLVRRQSEFRFHDATDPLPLALSALGLVTLAAGGWLGGKLAYGYGIRVADEIDRRAALTSDAD